MDKEDIIDIIPAAQTKIKKMGWLIKPKEVEIPKNIEKRLKKYEQDLRHKVTSLLLSFSRELRFADQKVWEKGADIQKEISDEIRGIIDVINADDNIEVVDTADLIKDKEPRDGYDHEADQDTGIFY